MTGRMLYAAAITLVLLALQATRGGAQSETVDLLLRLRSGEVVYYNVTASTQTSIELAPVRQSAEAQVQAREAHRVLNVDATGVALVEAVLEDLRVTVDGKVEEQIDEPWMLRVQPNGKVVDARPGLPEDFPVALPGRPVAVNDSWSRDLPIEEAGVTGRGTATFTLASIEQTAGGRIARIQHRTDGTVTGGSGVPLPPGSQGRAGGTVRGSGELEWAVDQGRMLRASNEVTIDVQAEVTGEGQTAQVRIVVRIRTTHSPLPASSVSAPTVPAELLISPGRGIGDITFELALAEVNARLGASTARDTGDLYSASSVRWPNRRAGFVDPSDPNKLIGLETADRRHRTERGLGFGSSEGAVLLAHGMSPARVEMMIPNLGGAKLLIYDDQGIAYAITSDESHARAGPEHAPVGAVDWVIVFPPGNAARIFRMP